jgi:2'-5' RNA ligase superfamily
MTISPDTIEANPRIRYGFYLRPSSAMCRAQAEMHDLLRRVFGLEVGGKFMPHATIMSFFRSEASLAAIKAAIDPVMAGRAPFTVTNRGLWPHGRSSVTLDVHHTAGGIPNQPLVSLHEAAFSALVPLVHPGCEFAFGRWSGDNFRAHLTLAMADIPDFLFDEVLAFTREAGPIGPASFTAEWFHLYAFDSDDWGGRWWETMIWKDLASWRLDP